MSLFTHETTLYLPGGLTDEEVLATYHAFREQNSFTPEEISEACKVFNEHIKPQIHLGTVEKKRFCDENTTRLYEQLMEESYPAYEALTKKHREYIQWEMENINLFSEKTREIWAKHPSYKHFHGEQDPEVIKDVLFYTVAKKLENLRADGYDNSKKQKL